MWIFGRGARFWQRALFVTLAILPQWSFAEYTSEQKKQFLEKGMQRLPRLEKFQDIDEKQLSRLIDFVDRRVVHWRKVCRSKKKNPLHKFRFSKKVPRRLIRIDLAECKTPIIHFREHLGSGAFKSVNRVLEFGTWKTLAEIKLLPQYSKQDLKDFQNETSILRSFQRCPRDGRCSLPKVYFQEPRRIFQKAYSLNLFDYIHEQTGPEIERLQIVARLTRGLRNLHHLGIVHSDIKLANAMIHDRNAVYLDFGLSYRPEDFIKKEEERPIAGTSGYISPETFGDWQGDSTEEKIKNALKADVFSHAILAWQVRHGDFVPWAYEGSDFETEFPTFRNRLQKNPFDQLIKESLSKEVHDRPTIDEFEERFEQYAMSFIRSKLDPGRKLGALLKGGKEKNFQISSASMEFIGTELYKAKNPNEGSLLLLQSPLYGDYRLMLAQYEQLDDSVRIIELDVDLLNYQQVQNDLLELQQDGILPEKIRVF